MAKFSHIFRKIKSHKFFYSHFAVELFLLLILTFAVGANLFLRANSSKAVVLNKSLFFIYLKNHPALNEKLVDAYESVNLTLKLTQNYNLSPKQILAASTIEKEQANIKIADAAAPLPTLSGSALLKPNFASAGLLPKRDTEVYQVRGGDTVTRIASAYGVSVDTIVWENNLSANGRIRPGQMLTILPISGVKHIVKDQENIASIAKKYGVDAEDIMEYNEIELEDHIFPGEEIIIPDGVKKVPPTPQRQQYLAGLQKEDYRKVEVPADYQGASSGLIWPMPAATRLSQKFWSRHRAIDVPCRDCQVIAAAEGIVELSGWQRGYGNTIVLNHGNGLKTRYGHGKELLVAAGASVQQGQAIMISGSTGRSSGPHLHFEVKKNGELLDPLTMVPR